MNKLTHVDDTGAARMVDVSEKDITRRTARAGGRVFMQPETSAALMEGAARKGGVMELFATGLGQQRQEVGRFPE